MNGKRQWRNVKMVDVPLVNFDESMKKEETEFLAMTPKERTARLREVRSMPIIFNRLTELAKKE